MTGPVVVYGELELSYPDLGTIDHGPICNKTELKNGGIALQGATRKIRQWRITCLTDSYAEIAALEDLFGQKLALTIDGTIYYGVMIAPPFTSLQITPTKWKYTIGFIQEGLY